MINIRFLNWTSKLEGCLGEELIFIMIVGFDRELRSFFHCGYTCTQDSEQC